MQEKKKAAEVTPRQGTEQTLHQQVENRTDKSQA